MVDDAAAATAALLMVEAKVGWNVEENPLAKDDAGGGADAADVAAGASLLLMSMGVT